MKKKILIIEDDRDIAELESLYLVKANFEVHVCPDGNHAITECKKTNPNLIILDLMLPFVDGLTICKQLKYDDELSSIPIVIVSAKGEEGDIVKGLDLGADDYVTKPFSPLELTARVRSVLRRTYDTDCYDGIELRRESLILNPRSREFRLDGEKVELSVSEFDTLMMLMKSPNRVFTRNQIIDNIHGEDYIATDRSVDVLISGLRKKLGDSRKLIRTIWGVGYRFGAHDE